MAKIIEQYTNGNYTKMVPGTIVLDYNFGCYWNVMSNNGKTVELKCLKGGENAVTMSVSNETSTFTFVLLDVVEEMSRYEELIINALEWAVNVSEQATHDLIRATGITSEELSEIGYDKENFPQMHKWVKEKEVAA